ncbi:hypothetical protein GSI_05544 [Ganoderma sinense ZZ0214-1]|uniref:DUF6534 domain-containing protein n=1 Tax=Ganoderma sinense ZZ0214-1 TaxID=1077348 RepID=A0A2G8SEV6_9APHY|nr:hypothetical protein GSI_05544 [Ganoderma sinense ZZ0214-1]
MAPSILAPTATSGFLPTPAPTSAPLLLPVSFDSTLGVVLVATLVSFGIYGVNLHQVWRYNNRYSHSDSWAIKAVVLCMSVADTMHSAMLAHMCYYYLVTNYVNPGASQSGVWSINLLPVSSATIIVLAQSFYARRVYLTNKKLWWLIIIIVILMITQLGFTIAAGVETYLAVTFKNWLHYIWTESVALAVAIGVDMILTCTAVATLWSNRTSFKDTNNVLNVLIVWTLNTCLLTTMLTVMCFISTILWPKDFFYIALNLVATKTYVSAVLAVLNSRESLSARIATSALQQSRSQRSIAGDNWQMMPISPTNPTSATFEVKTANTAPAFHKSHDLLAKPRGGHGF